jgi:poly(A) polymerase
MRDIWAMQPRFDRRVGKSPYKLLEHLRFRAGYDFLLLRCASGEIDEEIGEWWTQFQDADGPGRELLMARKLKKSGDKAGDAAPARKRRRKSSSASAKPGEEGQAANPGSDGPGASND